MADLSKMSRKQLERLIKDAQRALKSLETKEKREAKKAAEKAAAKYGFKLSELTPGGQAPRSSSGTPRSGSVSAPKYANPSDPSQTWTGKGRQPVWFKEAVAAGTAPDSMAI